MARRLSAVVGLFLVAAASCTLSPEPERAPTQETPPPTTHPQTGLWPVEMAPLARCDRPLPRSAHVNQGVRGEADRGSVVALLFFETRAEADNFVPVNTGVKIVWRVTGHGEVKFYATGPGGHRIHPRWGPEPHADSTFRYPGHEWGTGFAFPAPGCWTIHVQRDNLTGRLTLPVR